MTIFGLNVGRLIRNDCLLNYYYVITDQQAIIILLYFDNIKPNQNQNQNQNRC